MFFLYVLKLDYILYILKLDYIKFADNQIIIFLMLNEIFIQNLWTDFQKPKNNYLD